MDNHVICNNDALYGSISNSDHNEIVQGDVYFWEIILGGSRKMDKGITAIKMFGYSNQRTFKNKGRLNTENSWLFLLENTAIALDKSCINFCFAAIP